MTDQTIPPAAPAPLAPEQQRLWATLIHIGWIAGSFVGGLYFAPALIGYLVLKDRGGFIRSHTASALNFQISWTLWGIAIGVITVVTFGIGGLLFIPFGICYLIFTILAAVAANRGDFYTYPLTITFLR